MCPRMQRLSIAMFSIVFSTVMFSELTLAEDQPAEVLIKDSFETGTKAPDGWKQGISVRGVNYVYDLKTGSEGQRSLSLQKSEKGFFPIANWSRKFKYESQKPALKVVAKVKAVKVDKAVIDVLFLDASDEWISHKWVAYIGQKQPADPVATHDWKTYDGTVEIPAGTKQIGIAFQMYGPGNVWFDELDARFVDVVDADKKDGSKDTGARSTRPAATPTVPVPIEIPTASGGVARYLVIPPGDGVVKPKSGFPLLLVLPGGDGLADFHPFVNNIHQQALASRFVVAQVLAPPQIVWPTQASIAKSKSTGESLAAIVDQMVKQQGVDRQQVYALAWSSSGPAVYEAVLQEHSILAGAFIAMSVFKPNELPPLASAKGRHIYLLHSPEDAVCPYRMAQDAKEKLTAAGAEVSLVDYAGGHGWHGPVHEMLHSGMDWLQKRRPH